MNEVKIVVTGQYKPGGAVAALKRDIADLTKQAAQFEKIAQRTHSELGDGFSKASRQVDEAKSSIEKAGKAANDALKGLGEKAKVKIKPEIDKSGLGALDFSGVDITSGLGPKIAAAFGKGVDLTQAGAKGAASFVGGLGDGLKNQHPAVQAAVYGSLAVAAAAAAPLAGGALAGGIVAGFGAGIGGIGIVAAAQNEKVRQSYSTLWGNVVEDMKARSVVMEGVLLRTADRAQTAYDLMGRNISTAFDRLAPGFETLFDGVLRSAQSFSDQFPRFASGAFAVFNDLGQRLPGIVDEIADAFGDLADSVAQNPEALGDFLALVGEAIEIGADFVRVLNYMHEGNKQILDTLSKPLEWVGLKSVEQDTKRAAGSMIELSNAAGNTRLDSVTATFEALSKAEQDTAKWADEIRLRYERLLGITPMFDESVQAVNDTIRGLFEDFGKTGAAADGFGKDLINADGTINTLTANGSKLYDALTDLRGNFTDMAGSVRELESRGLSHADAVAKVNEQYATQSQRLLDNAAKFGLTRDEMAKVLEKAGLISGKKMDMTVALDTRRFYGELPELLKTRTLWINPQLTSTGLGVGASKLGGPSQAHAHGGVVARAAAGGVRSNVVVNDWGSQSYGEAIRLPQGSTVIPAAMTRSMESRWGTDRGAGQAAAAPRELKWIGPPDIIQWLKTMVRENGGDASVFGGGA